jgi:hypothetical protein
MEYILVGVAAGVAFIVVMAAIDVGLFIVGAAAGALMANLVLHFVRIPIGQQRRQQHSTSCLHSHC